MTTLKFGKYAGETIEDIAISDPDYAAWAATNLKNEGLRRQFDAALKAAKTASAARIAEAHGLNHIPAAVKMIEAEVAARDARVAREQAILAKYAARLGVGEAKLTSLFFSLYGRELSPAQFSSRAKYEAMVEFLAEYAEVDA